MLDLIEIKKISKNLGIAPLNIKKELFFGYEKIDRYYIALPEKALLDSVYLLLRNKRLLDLSSINIRKINKERLYKYARKFPEYVLEKLKLFL